MVMPSSVNMDPSADPLIGHMLGGKYTLEQMIGRGGMGHVYSAHHDEKGERREVVVKMIAPPLAQQPQAMARFEREAKRLDGLRHSNIVEMFDYGRDGGRAYIVMEFVDGELLSDYMSRKGRLTLAEFVPIAAQVLKGVGHAHSRDLMIRDIKPANVMLCERKGRANFVKIIDFGLAKMLEGEEDITKQHFIGTSGYLSPEQIKGIHIDLRVDVYALGVLFYQMLSGRMPFEAENDTTLLYKHVHEFPTPLSEVLPEGHNVPDELVHMIHDCLEKDPEQRPHDANDIVERLIDCVPMAMFKLPAVTPTAAHTAISALSTSALNAPTGETATFLRMEEVASAAGSAAGNAAVSSASGSRSSGSSSQPLPAIATPVTQEHESKSKTGLIIGAVAGAAAIAVVAVLFMGQGGDPPEPKDAQAAAPAPDNTALEAAITEAETLVASGDFAGALAKLAPVRRQLDGAPALEGSVARLDKQIKLGQLIATAKQLDEDGVTAAAIRAYEDVVTADPSNTEARTRIEELKESVGGDNGLIEISSEPNADLLIDGSPAGNTPYGKPLPLGKHTLTIKAEGYETWERKIEIKAGDNLPIDIKLTKLASDDDKKKATKKKPTPADDAPPAVEPEPKPEPEPDNPFLPTKKKKKKSNGLFLPTEN